MLRRDLLAGMLVFPALAPWSPALAGSTAYHLERLTLDPSARDRLARGGPCQAVRATRPLVSSTSWAGVSANTALGWPAAAQIRSNRSRSSSITVSSG